MFSVDVAGYSCLRYQLMKDRNRSILAKETIYYGLGIFLIFGFVYLYWGHFSNSPGPPAAIRSIMGRHRIGSDKNNRLYPIQTLAQQSSGCMDDAYGDAAGFLWMDENS